ncbi:MAG: hypothetical protein C4317_03315 [Acidimicrobiia bacterium]
MDEDPKDTIDVLESVWASIDELCSGLSAHEWDLPTDCPGWTVKDQVSHIIGTESMLAGKPTPDQEVVPRPYVKNRIGEMNEVHVEARRRLPPEEVLAEFRSITQERLEDLRNMSLEEFGRQVMTPEGPGSYLDFMKIRVFDCWVHEQDIRRAVKKPGNLAGKAARNAVSRCFKAMPYVVEKKAAFPEGASVTFVISYRDTPPPDKLTVTVKSGRGIAVDSFEALPSVKFRSDVGTYVALCSGRINPRTSLKEGIVELAGDETLGYRLIDNLAFVI